MLAHRLPYPPRTGDKVRAYHVARHLARHHALTLASLVDEPGADAAIRALGAEIPDLEVATVGRRTRRVQALLALLAGGSATMTYFGSAGLRARVAARLAADRFDLIYVSSSSMAPYVPGLGDVPVVMDFVDVDSDKWRQYGARLPFPAAWVYRLEGSRLARHEASAAWRARRCLVATALEETLLRVLAPWAAITVIPNGVDLEYFTPAPTAAATPTVVFTGAMDYFPNADGAVHFARTIFPRVRAAVPEARFVIVGKNPAPAVRRLASLPGVGVTGSVADVRPYLEDAAVAVAPLRVARGVQNKILEAMAAALPVVATPRAYEGLEARIGAHLLVEDDPPAFAEAVIRLLGSPDLRSRLGRAARAFVETHHCWSASMARLDQVLTEVAGAPVTATVSGGGS